MGFSSGSIAFRRFQVVGNSKIGVEQDDLDKLTEHAFRESDLGVPEEVEYGWSGGRHVFDGHFSFENNVFADAISFALRIDTNKIPSATKKAWQHVEEEAAARSNPSGFISKAQRRDVKDTIRRKVEEELRTGKYRRSKLLPILWDVSGKTLYCVASGANLERLTEIFERTFGLELQPLTAGSIAGRTLQGQGKSRDYEDLKPTRFVIGPEGEGQAPDYPWVAKGVEPKDFLGNEFLLWLWHEADAKKAVVPTSKGEVTVFIDKSLDLDCAYGQTGKDSIRGDGPSRMPEARDALRAGKLPRRFGVILDVNKAQFALTLAAETVAVSGAQLPPIDDAESGRVLFEDRIVLLRDLSNTIDALFTAFLQLRTSSGWEGRTSDIRRWIQSSGK